MKKDRLKRKLQRNFVLISLAALALLLGVIFGVNATLGWRDQQTKADRMIEEIRLKDDAASRYFVVASVEEKGVMRVEKIRNLDLTGEKALSLAKAALAEGKDAGSVADYRYRLYRKEGAARIIFLSRAASLELYRSSLRTLGFVSLAGLALAALILAAVSGRVVRPLTENRRRQKEFITAAGHELKTPLTVMRTDAQLLEAETGENEWLTDLEKQIDRMAKMTERLVTLARSEELTDEAKREFSLTDAVCDLLESYRAPFSRGGRTLETGIREGVKITGDERAAREMIATLFDNAEKYCPDGGSIRVTLSEKHREAIIAVENTASGLDPDEIAKLVRRFERGKSAAGKTGFGLGLSIAAAVAEKHHGALSVSVPAPDRFLAVVTLR